MNSSFIPEKNHKRELNYSFSSIGILIAILGLFLITIPLQAQSQYVTPDGEGDITFTPGLRIQTRYTYNEVDKNNDIYIARVRLKGNGKVFNLASYYFEVKIDNVGRFNKTPSAEVENAWLNFPVIQDFDLRVGFYDIVFSRNALTSDSKLLLMDRSLIKDAITGLGMADNTIGVLAHGRPLGGHLSYGFGIFDNLGFEIEGMDSTILARKSDGIMTAGRLVYDFLDPAPSGGYADYQSSYLGKGQRLTLGTNAAYLSKAQIRDSELAIIAWGADLFFNYGPATIEAEYDSYNQDFTAAGIPDMTGGGWYAQGGYLFHPLFELVARYQEFDPDKDVTNDKLKWTSIGFNMYIRGHKLKIQAEYTFKTEESNEVDNNAIQVQLQLDF